MKKIFITVLFCMAGLLSSNAFAQLGVNVGYLNTVRNNKVEVDNHVAKSDMALNGFYLGVDYNIHLVAGLGVAPGLNLQFAFYNENFDGLEGTPYVYEFPGFMPKEIVNHETFCAIEIPVLFNYSFAIAPAVTLGVYAGPVFGVGLSDSRWTVYNGEDKDLTTDKLDVYESQDILNDKSFFKRFEVDLAFGASISYNNYRFNVGYQCGLSNISNIEYTTVKANSLRIGVGYVF